MTIERGIKPPKRRSKWADKFKEMEPGDSFKFEGTSPSTVALAFGYWLAKGNFSIIKEDDGYRFFWLKPKQEGK